MTAEWKQNVYLRQYGREDYDLSDKAAERSNKLE